VVVAGWAGRGTAPAPQAQDSDWAAVEDPVEGPGVVAVARLEAGRLAVPVCGNPVARGAAELAGERVQVAEVVRVGPAVAPEALEPAAERREERARVVDPLQVVVAVGSAVAERRGELKAPGLENG
jgi:hypothetical protein